MVDLTDYEHVGDPDAAVTLDRRAHGRQQQAEASREHAKREAAKAPPMSAETAVRVARLMSVRTPPHQLMRWRLRLYCGHVVERSAHIESIRSPPGSRKPSRSAPFQHTIDTRSTMLVIS